MEKNINRRDFIKAAGAGALATGATILTGCGSSDTKKTTAVVTTNDNPISDGMPYHINEHNGDKVSILGYGCMRWPMIKDKDGKDVIDQEKVNELIDVAMANGVNYYDTSPAYLQGQSEKASGIALNRYPRKSYYLATKLSNFSVFTREASEKMYHDSFEQMETDYFDYYLLHNIGNGGYQAFARRYEENGIMDFLLKEREKGNIRQLGFSFHGNQEGFEQVIALHEKYHWDFVQIQMNYVDWRHADGVRNVNAEYLYEELDKRELPITIMEPLQGGRLSRVPENVAKAMKERSPEKSIASWAFRFVGSYPRVLTALSGMTYMEHLQDNLDTFLHFQELNQDEKDFLEQMAILIKEFPTVDCNDCKYCMPCPYGIDIPEIFKQYNNCVNEGKFPQSVEQENYRKLKRQYLLSYDRAIPTLRQADHCIGCGQCMPHCPQSIRIPTELQRIDRYVENLRQNTL
ncbi:MAG: aldo/keto reductase [Bacteroidales bacterium]|nr:aldo/keto reductase [Bacteroidales bacterium]